MAEHLNPVTGNRVIPIAEEPALTAAVEADLALQETETQAAESILNHAYEEPKYYQRAREMAADAVEDNANAATLGLSPVDIAYNDWMAETVSEALTVEPPMPSATMVIESFGPASEQDKKNMAYYVKSFDTVVDMYCGELKNDVNYNKLGYDHASSQSRKMWYGTGGSLEKQGADFRKAINTNPQMAAMFEAKLASMAEQAAAAARDLAPSVDPRFNAAASIDPNFGTNFDPRNPQPISMANLDPSYVANAAKRAEAGKYESIIKYNLLVEVSRVARAGSIHELRANFQERNGFTPTELYNAANIRADDAVNYYNSNRREIKPETTHQFFTDMVAMSDYITNVDSALAEIARTHDVTTPLAKAELMVARADAFERMNKLRFRQQELIMARAEVQGIALGSPNPDYSGQLVGLAPSQYVQPLDRNRGIFLTDSRTIVYPDGTYGLLGPRRSRTAPYPIVHMNKFGALI